MVGGLARGLSHRDAARFSFLLATPVILAAGVLKPPSLAGPAGAHIHGQVLLGALLAGVASYVSVKWLTRYFETRTLTPCAILQPHRRRHLAHPIRLTRLGCRPWSRREGARRRAQPAGITRSH